MLTPHLGYGVKETGTQFYGQSLENALGFFDGKPVRVMNPEAIPRRLIAGEPTASAR